MLNRYKKNKNTNTNKRIKMNFCSLEKCFFVLPNTILLKAGPECLSSCPSSVFTNTRVAALLLQENRAKQRKQTKETKTQMAFHFYKVGSQTHKVYKYKIIK